MKKQTIKEWSKEMEKKIHTHTHTHPQIYEYKYKQFESIKIRADVEKKVYQRA